MNQNIPWEVTKQYYTNSKIYVIWKDLEIFENKNGANDYTEKQTEKFQYVFKNKFIILKNWKNLQQLYKKVNFVESHLALVA